MTFRVIAGIAALSLLAMGAPVGANDYPTRPVTLVVPNAAGGGMDTVARILARRLSVELGQSVVVENRAGGSENVGIGSVTKAAPDGYTLLLASNSITINSALFKSLPYDVNKDLQPLGRVASLPLLVVVGIAMPYKSLGEMIAYAKANPNKLSYGSPGPGTPHHLAMELIKSSARIDIQHIPYKGTAPGMTDLLAGNIPVLMSTIATAEPHMKASKIRALATLEPVRVKQFPDLPAVSELLPAVGVGIWHGVFAPSGTPQAVSAKISAALETVLKDPELEAQLAKVGVIASWAPPAVVSAAIKSEQASWATAIKNAGIEVR